MLISLHLLLLFAVFFLSLPFSSTKLVQVIHIARHGARTPSSFEFKPQQYPEEAGELTVFGRVQYYHFGQEMRKRYISENKLLSEEFNPDQVIVKASGKPRVLASAYAFLNGLYPQNNGIMHENMYANRILLENLLPLNQRLHKTDVEDIMNITINETWAKEIVMAMPADKDMFFNADQGNNCPAAAKRIKHLKNSIRILKLEQNFRRTVYPPIVEVINTALNTNKLSIDALDVQKAKRILDSYRCNSFHNVEYPLFNQTTLELLEELRYNWIYQILYKDDFVKSVAVSQLLEDISGYVTRFVEGKKDPKFVLYAAHDHNIEALFSILLEEEVLRERKYFMVEFAAIFTIELHIKENVGVKEEEYYVEFLYNDEPLLVKWCGNGSKCSIDQFKEIVRSFTIPNLQEACNVF